MKRVYKGSDIRFNVTINDFPINFALVDKVEFRFYTLNPSNFIIKDQSNLDKDNILLLEWNDLSRLEEGVLYYDVKLSLKDDNMVDGTLDKTSNIMTEYYIMSGIGNIDIPVESTLWGNITGNIENQSDLISYIHIYLSDFYNKVDIDELLKTKAEKLHTHSQYLTQHQDISGLATKEELSGKQDKGNYLTEHQSLENYYTKLDIDGKGYLTTIPEDYITESKLAQKGYLTQHQDISGKADKSDTYTKEDVNLSINTVKEDVKLKADKADTYTKGDIDGMIGGVNEKINQINSMI